MDLFKKASRKKLRISTPKGNLSVEQLWDLNLTELDALAVSLQDAVEKSSNRSFLSEKSSEDVEAKLRFDIVLDVLQTKLADQETAAKRAETRAQNQRIAEIIARKEDESLESLSIEELKAKLS